MPELSKYDNVRDFINATVDEHQVVVFSKTYCPYCSATKRLLATAAFQNVDVITYELDQMQDGPKIQRELLEMTGQQTVPSVFVDGHHLGGNNETQQAFRAGRFSTTLNPSSPSLVKDSPSTDTEKASAILSHSINAVGLHSSVSK